MATLLRRPRPGLGAGTQPPGTWARYANVGLGIWLFVSALLWLQAPGPRLNALIVGLLIAGVSVWALWVEEARFIDSGLAVWLLFSTLAIFDLQGAPLWNDLAVALAVFGLSLIANDAGAHLRRFTGSGRNAPPR